MGTVISIRVSDETKENIDKYKIQVSTIARQAIEQEIERKQLEEAREAANTLGEFFSQVPEEKIMETIKETRRTR
jgi:predicted transcriptional regulator